MKFCLRILTLLLLITGCLSQDLNLADALDPDPTPAKPTEKPKAPEKPKSGDGGLILDLGDAVEPDKPAIKPPKTEGGGGGGGLGGGGEGFNLEDALGPDPNPEPKKPVNPPKSGGGGGGGGGSFDDSDLIDAAGGDYKPDGGRSGHSGNSDPQGGADQPQDPDLLWGQILKMLNANMPEEFYAWLSNLKKTVEPLLERALDLLHAAP